MAQIAFVVWREAVEALLVIGVLNAWLSHGTPDGAPKAGRLALWVGVASGLVLAGALGAILLFFSELFGEEGEDYLQAAMALLAAGLIVQLAVWSRRKGGSWGADLRRDLDSTVGGTGRFGVFLLAALAVAREGSETVVFLYGNVVGLDGSELPFALAAAGAGLLAALLTYGLVQLGGAVLSWRLFFRVTETMLLLLAAALTMTGIDRLVGLGIVPQLTPPLWSTAWLLDDGSPLGNLVASLTGYRATPDLTQLAVYLAFWVLVWLALGTGRRRSARLRTSP